MNTRSSVLIGRRTRTNILKDKEVRKDKDGNDVFEDYWTDSGDESTMYTKSIWTDMSDSSKQGSTSISNVGSSELRRSKRRLGQSISKNGSFSNYKLENSSIRRVNGKSSFVRQTEKVSKKTNEKSTVNSSNVSIHEAEKVHAQSLVITHSTPDEKNVKKLRSDAKKKPPEQSKSSHVASKKKGQNIPNYDELEEVIMYMAQKTENENNQNYEVIDIRNETCNVRKRESNLNKKKDQHLNKTFHAANSKQLDIKISGLETNENNREASESSKNFTPVSNQSDVPAKGFGCDIDKLLLTASEDTKFSDEHPPPELTKERENDSLPGYSKDEMDCEITKSALVVVCPRKELSVHHAMKSNEQDNNSNSELNKSVVLSSSKDTKGAYSLDINDVRKSKVQVHEEKQDQSGHINSCSVHFDAAYEKNSLVEGASIKSERSETINKSKSSYLRKNSLEFIHQSAKSVVEDECQSESDQSVDLNLRKSSSKLVIKKKKVPDTNISQNTKRKTEQEKNLSPESSLSDVSCRCEIRDSISVRPEDSNSIDGNQHLELLELAEIEDCAPENALLDEMEVEPINKSKSSCLSKNSLEFIHHSAKSVVIDECQPESNQSVDLNLRKNNSKLVIKKKKVPDKSISQNTKRKTEQEKNLSPESSLSDISCRYEIRDSSISVRPKDSNSNDGNQHLELLEQVEIEDCTSENASLDEMEPINKSKSSKLNEISHKLSVHHSVKSAEQDDESESESDRSISLSSRIDKMTELLNARTSNSKKLKTSKMRHKNSKCLNPPRSVNVSTKKHILESNKSSKASENNVQLSPVPRNTSGKMHHSSQNKSKCDLECHVLNISRNPALEGVEHEQDLFFHRSAISEQQKGDFCSESELSDSDTTKNSSRTGRKMKDVSNDKTSDRGILKSISNSKKKVKKQSEHCADEMLPQLDAENTTQRKKAGSKSKKRKSPEKVDQDFSQSPAKIRKSNRQKFAPLDHWRNERIYHRYEKGQIIVEGVVKGSAEDRAPINSICKTISTKNHKRKKSQINKVYDELSDKYVAMKLATFYHSTSWNMDSPDKPYRIKKMVQSITTTFGYIEIDGLEAKPSQFMPDVDLQMTVMRGKVEVVVQENKFEIKERDMFIVPRSTAYSIKNLQDRKALLFFVVGRFKFVGSSRLLSDS